MAWSGTLFSALITSGLVSLGMWEKKRHAAALARIPLRVHVNGTRGKTSVTHQIAAVFRLAGERVVAKSTGTEPILVTPDGTTKPWPRRGRARIQEQIRVLNYAAKSGAQVCVLECMALAPEYQWFSEHRIVRAHIGVITNVRRDHFEEMGDNLDDIARSLANTIPYNGHIVTGDARYAQLFAQIAAERGSELHLAVPEAGVPSSPAEQNWAITRQVAAIAGIAPRHVEAARRMMPEDHPPTICLPHPASGSTLLHVGAINDTDSFAAFIDGVHVGGLMPVPLYNHRRDRPLRARAFAEFFVARSHQFPRLLLTGHKGAAAIFRRAGVPAESLQYVPLPITAASVAAAVAPWGEQCTVLLCGNAQGVPEWETAGHEAVG